MWTDSVSAFNGHNFHILHDSRYRHDPMVADIIDDFTGEALNIELDLNVHSELVAIVATVATMVELFHKKVTMYWRTEDFDLPGTLHLIDWYLLEQIPYMTAHPSIAEYITKRLMPFRAQVLHEVHCMFGRRSDILTLYLDHENTRRGVPPGTVTIRSVMAAIESHKLLTRSGNGVEAAIPIPHRVRHIFPLQQDVQGLIDATLGRLKGVPAAVSTGFAPQSVAFPGRPLF